MRHAGELAVTRGRHKMPKSFWHPALPKLTRAAKYEHPTSFLSCAPHDVTSVQMGILDPMLFQKPHRSSNNSYPTWPSSLAPITNCRPDENSGTPDTLALVSFSLFGSPVMKNDAIAPVKPRYCRESGFCTWLGRYHWTVNLVSF